MMQYQEALEKAQRILKDLTPFCERIEIAGSVRRKKQTEIKDIEIICIQKMQVVKNMFGDPISSEGLLEVATHKILCNWRAAALQNGPKWKKIIFPDATKLDLFIVTAETWGTQFAIKTGPSDYSKWLVKQKRFGGAFPSYAKFTGSFDIEAHGKKIPMREEADFFNFLKISPIPHPTERAVPKQFTGATS